MWTNGFCKLPFFSVKHRWKTALIGAGIRGGEHLEALVSLSDRFELAAICDLRPAQASRLAAKIDVHTSTDARTLLQAERPDYLLVAVGLEDRAAVWKSLESAACFPRAILLEKPLAASAEELERLRDWLRDKGTALIGGLQLRFSPEFQHLREALVSGNPGRLLHVEASCLSVAWDQGPHLFDLVSWLLLGERIERLDATSASQETLRRENARACAAGIPLETLPEPAWLQAHLLFASGLSASLNCGPLASSPNPGGSPWLQIHIRVFAEDGIYEACSAAFFKSPETAQGFSIETYRGATRALHASVADFLDGQEASPDLPRDDRVAFGQATFAAALYQALPRPPNTEAPLEAPVTELQPWITILLPLLDERGHGRDCIAAWVNDQTAAPNSYRLAVYSNGTLPELEKKADALLRPHDLLRIHPFRDEMEMYDAGVRAAQTPWIFLTEPHCLPDPDLLVELRSYLKREAMDGCCIRSTLGWFHPLARQEADLFERGFRGWSRPGAWQKVILRGLALKRELFLEAGGFEVEYSRFAEWALAARLNEMRVKLGYASGAVVRHFDSTCLKLLGSFIEEFTRGECRYRESHEEAYCRRYFGSPAEWEGANFFNPELCGAALGLLLKSPSWGRWWRNLAGRLFLQVLTGGKADRWRKEAAVWCLRLRLNLLAACGKTNLNLYQRFYQARTELARLRYLNDTPRPEPKCSAADPPASLTEWPSQALFHVHPAEQWEGKSFRWMGPAAALRLPRHWRDGTLRLALLEGIRAPEDLTPRAMLGGRRLHILAAGKQVFEIELPACRKNPEAEEWLYFFQAPLAALAPETRDLALPVESVTFHIKASS